MISSWDAFGGLSLRPSEGGAVERPFGTFNIELFSTLPGYTGSKIQERPEDAEQNARMTLRSRETCGFWIIAKLIDCSCLDFVNRFFDCV